MVFKPKNMGFSVLSRKTKVPESLEKSMFM